MAGFMIALTSIARGNRGVPQAEVTRRLLIRGPVLIAVDALIMGLPRALMGVASVEFWTFAKYPPDLPFLGWSFACIFLSLAVLSTIARERVPILLRPFVVFGRVPFFFYVVHFYVLGLTQAILRAKLGLPETYLIWLLLLLAMAWPCAWYYEKKRNRPNLVTRYF
jgi:hypothetical protein